MCLSEKIGIGFTVLVVMFCIFCAGMAFQKSACIGYLEGGEKFIDTEDGKYLMERWVLVDKLPNGLYRCDSSNCR